MPELEVSDDVVEFLERFTIYLDGNYFYFPFTVIERTPGENKLTIHLDKENLPSNVAYFAELFIQRLKEVYEET